MTDLSAVNELFAHGVSIGLNWTRGEAANGRPTIFVPSRDRRALRADLHLHAHVWMLSWTTPLHGTESIKIDKLHRSGELVLRALAVALGVAVDRSVEAEPTSALEIIRFLGALGVATENDAALGSAVAGRRRAQAILDHAPWRPAEAE